MFRVHLLLHSCLFFAGPFQLEAWKKNTEVDIAQQKKTPSSPRTPPKKKKTSIDFGNN